MFFFLVASHLFWTRSGLLSPTVRHEILWKQSRCLLLQIWSCFQFFLVLFLRGEDSKNMSQERFLHSPQKLMNFNSDGCHEALFGCEQHLTSKQEGSCWTPWWSLAWNKHRMVRLWFGWSHYMKYLFTEASSSSWLMGHLECLFWFRFFFCPKLMANRSRYTGDTSVFMVWNELFQPLRLNQFCYHPIIPSHRGWIASCALRNGVAFRPGIVPGTTKSHRLNSCLS